MDENNHTLAKDNEKKLQEASLKQEENLRSAIYNYELKTISNLQFINGGGAAVLVGFLSRSPISSQSKCYFFTSIISFILGLLCSILLAYISPEFLDLRLRQNEKPDEYKKYNCYRILCLFASFGFFALAIVLSLLGWIIAS